MQGDMIEEFPTTISLTTAWGVTGGTTTVVRPRRGTSFCQMLEALAVEILEEEQRKEAEAAAAAPKPREQPKPKARGDPATGFFPSRASQVAREEPQIDAREALALRAAENAAAADNLLAARRSKLGSSGGLGDRPGSAESTNGAGQAGGARPRSGREDRVSSAKGSARRGTGTHTVGFAVPSSAAPSAPVSPTRPSRPPAPVKLSVVLANGAPLFRDLVFEPSVAISEIFVRAEQGLGQQVHALTAPGGRCLERTDSVRQSALRSGTVLTAWPPPPVQVFATSAAFVAVRADEGSAMLWGDATCGGSCSRAVREQLSSGVLRVFSNDHAFAALKRGGAVVTWGDPAKGGDSSAVYDSLSSNVYRICSTESAFAALRGDGSVVAWGGAGGDASAVASHLASGVQQLCATKTAFAAVKGDGSVVTWGDEDGGGDSTGVQHLLAASVVRIFSSDAAFAALRRDGSVVTWGQGGSGGDSGAVEQRLSEGVENVCATTAAFSALKQDGSVITWGHGPSGGDSREVKESLRHGVAHLYATHGAFAALKTDGSVIMWGHPSCGGSGNSLREVSIEKRLSMRTSQKGTCGEVEEIGMHGQLAGGVEHIVASVAAFAAVKGNGSVVAWGDGASGGDCSKVGGELARGVRRVFASHHAFAALMADGSIVAWGGNEHGGDCHAVQKQLARDVDCVFATQFAFAAVKTGGDIVTWGHEAKGGGRIHSTVSTPAPSPLGTPTSTRRSSRVGGGAASPPNMGDSSPTLPSTLLPPKAPKPAGSTSSPTLQGLTRGLRGVLGKAQQASPQSSSRGGMRSQSEKGLTLPPLQQDSARSSQAQVQAQAQVPAQALAQVPAPADPTAHRHRRDKEKEKAPVPKPVLAPEPSNNDAFWASVEASLLKEPSRAPAGASHSKLSSLGLGRKSAKQR